MELSARIKKEAEQYGVPPQTLVLADLMSIGYTENEAYNIAYPENRSFSKAQNVSIRDNITGTLRFKDMLAERKSRLTPNITTTGTGETKPQLSKEEIASKLRDQLDLLPDGSKEKADVLMKYADLFSYKKEEKKADEEDIIRVWVPLTCDICPYKKMFEDNKK